jgi:acrylyl-CoA reductase (NADPH)
MKAVVLRNADGVFSKAVEDFPADNKASNAILAVQYSSLNYKDALALTNRSPIVRAWPMIPGIDAAGTVKSNREASILPGDLAVVTGWGLGETRLGGFGEEVQIEPRCLTQLSKDLSPWDAAAIGTAGLTAMLCVMAIERHGTSPADGPVLVTGASGGVGGIALILLKRLGYQTIASTGRLTEADYLKQLGADSVFDRREISGPGKPLQKERWTAAIDSVGSVTLANVCASTRYGGIVTACGLAQGMDFPATVAPFILRGICLAGIDSVMAPAPLRAAAWSRLADLADRAMIRKVAREISLEETFDAAEDLLAGRVRGRLVVRI